MVRVRGMFFWSSDQTAATEFQLASLGMAVVSDQAIAAGAASLPDPVGDEASDLWFVYKSVASGVVAGAANGNIRGHMVEFDSKAMRKVPEGADIAVMVGNESSTFGLNFQLKFRLLVKLH